MFVYVTLHMTIKQKYKSNNIFLTSKHLLKKNAYTCLSLSFV